MVGLWAPVDRVAAVVQGAMVLAVLVAVLPEIPMEAMAQAEAEAVEETKMAPEVQAEHLRYGPRRRIVRQLDLVEVAVEVLSAPEVLLLVREVRMEGERVERMKTMLLALQVGQELL